MTRIAVSASHTPRSSASRGGKGNPAWKTGGASGGIGNVPNLGHRWTRSVGRRSDATSAASAEAIEWPTTTIGESTPTSASSAGRTRAG
jgi:hypothetical protein